MLMYNVHVPSHVQRCYFFLACNEMIFSFLCRHVVRFSILRPTTDLIAQMYYCRGASKIW